VLLLRTQAVIDDLAIRRVLVDLGCGIGERTMVPEARTDLLRLVEHLLLLHQLHEEDVERADRHDDEQAERDPSDGTALLKCGDEAIFGRFGGSCGRCSGEFDQHMLFFPMTF